MIDRYVLIDIIHRYIQIEEGIFLNIIHIYIEGELAGARCGGGE